MGKITQSSTLRVEDFDSEQRKWLPRLFAPINLFITSVTNVINGRIEFGTNIPSQDALLSFTYGSSAQRFTWGSNLTPRVLWVGQSFEGNDNIALVPQWTYDASTGMISVNFLKADGSALTVGQSYKVFVRVAP